jgi:hypothetical protein
VVYVAARAKTDQTNFTSPPMEAILDVRKMNMLFFGITGIIF